LDYEVTAAGWFGKIHGGFLGHAGGDGLEVVGVVDGELWVEGCLLQEVDAAIGDTDAVHDQVSTPLGELELGLEIFRVDGSEPASSL